MSEVLVHAPGGVLAAIRPEMSVNVQSLGGVRWTQHDRDRDRRREAELREQLARDIAALPRVTSDYDGADGVLLDEVIALVRGEATA